VKRALILAVMAASSMASPMVARAQQGAETPPSEVVGGLPFAGEVEVTVVNVNVYVTDKNGLAVTDLSADDFVLTQDGTERQISNFGLFTEEIYRNFYRPESLPVGLPTPTPVPGSEVLSRDSLRPVYVVFYFDNENSRPLDRNRLITELRSFVRENLHPPVQMMVITYTKSYDVLQPFTSDPRLIYDALREVKTMIGGRTELDSQRTDILRNFAEHSRNATQGSSPSQVGNYGGNMSRDHGMLISFAEEEMNSLQFTLGALRDTVTMLSGLPGKKIVIYVSNGLPMICGLDLFYAYANTFHESSAITESARYNMSRQFTSLVANANAQDVSFYTFGVGGLENPTLAGSELGNQQDLMSASIGAQNYLDSLRFMAENTGGAATINTNNFTKGLERTAQDFYTHYSLGYSLNQGGLDKVHRIKVEIPGHPEYRVRYRRRFVEKSLESRVQDKVVTGLMFPLEDNPMEIMVEIDSQTPAGDTRWMVPFKLSVPLRKVALLPSGDDYVGNVTMFIAARNTDGDRSDVVRRQHEIRVKAADYEKSQLKRHTITANLLMEAGRHNVAVGLLDPVTRQSSFATTKVTVQE
jgi:VWFA-related protein